MKGLYFLIILSWSLKTVALDIRTSADFSNYTQLHIQRVQTLGQELKKQYPNHFGDLDDKIVQKFLSLHDQSKLEPEILRSLSGYYGRSMESLTPAEKVKFTKLKDKLNAKDLQIRMDFLKQNGLMDRHGKISLRGRKILSIEKIADLVDRGSAIGSSREFGRPMASGSSYLKTPLSKKMAQALESVYPKVVDGKAYKDTFVRWGKTTGKAALGLGKFLSVPLAIFGELADAAESIASDEEEFKIFYEKHPEFTPHKVISPEAVK